MRELDRRFKETLEQLAPVTVLMELLRTKLAEEDAPLTENELAELAARLLRSEDGIVDIELSTGEFPGLSLEFGQSDLEFIDRASDEFLGTVQQLVGDIAEELADEVDATPRGIWPGHRSEDNQRQTAFEARVRAEWGDVLVHLEELRYVATEFGEAVFEDDDELDAAGSLLARLHARGCQIAYEVIALCAGGFADGAMARWRTLHEVAVVAFLIADGGDDLAERYVAHEVVESWRAARDYSACAAKLGYEPLGEMKLEELQDRRRSLLALYGKEFDGQYGWAATHLGAQRPTFRDLEEATELEHLRAHYRMASHNVHANPKGVFFKLGLLAEDEFLLAGPSGFGLAEPLQSAGISLLQVSAAPLKLFSTLDNIVILKIMSRILDRLLAAVASRTDEAESRR